MSQGSHAFAALNPRLREGLTLTSRRGMLKASLAGMAGLSLPGLLRAREAALKAGRPMDGNRAVILLWMAGGPSHIDTLDPKPDQPENNRGPFGVIPTTHPGIVICEHLPKYARLTDKLTLIRSVDCRESNHQPNTVMQTGVRAAEPRINPEARHYPALAAMVGKWHGAGHPAMPPAVALNVRDRTHFAWSGWLGDAHEPMVGDDAAKLFQLPEGLTLDRARGRRTLSQQMDQLRAGLDRAGVVDAMDGFGQRAFDLVAGGRAQGAFDLSMEPQAVRDRYGPHPWAQKALLARRLVEAGVSFVTLDLSNHSASGTWDTHGDKFPPYGGIVSGLKPLLPVFDHLFTTLVLDLEERGLLRDVLVIAMGEFGRSPEMGTQGSPDGRNHWAQVMSMTMAGGRFRHGQVIGSTDRDGGQIHDRPVTPGDIAATLFYHFGIPLDATYPDHRGRPRYIVEHGEPLRELI